MKSSGVQKVVKKFILLMFVIMTGLSGLQGQEQQKPSIKGQLKDQHQQAVAFATVALRRLSDSTLITGTASNMDGEFSLESLTRGKYCLIVSAIGYNRVSVNIDLTDNFNAGIILLQEKAVALDEIVVVGERIKAKTEANKTTFFVNKKMYDVSDNGVDLLSYIPGVQVDLLKNISLEGSQHIIIQVDGKERDRNYLSQLNSDLIDKVEVISTPDSRYDADVTGVINIILKKDKKSGINGHIHAEVPTSESVYIFPDYSFNYNFKKLNLYTSYDGSLSYLDIVENSNRTLRTPDGETELVSDQKLRQKDWSHRFHYGFDYFLNEKNQINFYAFYNPYSNELSGNVDLNVSGDNTGDQYWSAQKKDYDINRSAFYSLYFKHLFSKPQREINVDLSYYNFKAENTTTYLSDQSTSGNFLQDQVNTVKPEQNSVILRIDYTSPVSDKLKFDSGVKVRSQLLKDIQSPEFKYDETVFALYGTLTYTSSKYTFNAGLRAEESTSGLATSFNNKVFALMPNVTLSYKPAPKQNIKLAYSRSVYRPNIYELNPYTSLDDPYTIQSGNPELKPEFRQNLSLEYSKNIENSFVSFQLFYKKRANAINHYMFINESDMFETLIGNLGDINRYGIQISGTVKLHKAITVNPFFSFFNVSTRGNSLSTLYNIENRNKIAFESGLSAIVTFRHDISASLQFQYNSPQTDIQSLSFSDALYFVSIEKNFSQKFKVGIMSALPFSKSFTYQGSEVRGENFYSHSEGNVKLSVVPVWLKFTYQFNSGKKSEKINREKEEVDNMPKKGF